MKERINKILEILSINKRVKVKILSEKLQVSEVTIRKDLDFLEGKGIIKREHGVALLSSSDDINSRIAYNYETKKEIAKRAVKLVSDNDTIMIESGSSCALFAEELTKKRNNLTIITNSAFIANYIRSNKDFKIVLLGGIYQKDSEVTVGPMIGENVKNFFVDLFFIGSDGFSDSVGFTNRDQMRAQAVRDMAKQAEKVVVLTDSEKFLKHGTVPLNLKNKINTVITDRNIKDNNKLALKERGIEVITV